MVLVGIISCHGLVSARLLVHLAILEAVLLVARAVGVLCGAAIHLAAHMLVGVG